MRLKKQYSSTMRDEYEIKYIQYHNILNEINFLNIITFEMESII